MIKKICFINFWNTFNYNNNFITSLFEKYKIEFVITSKDDADILIVGTFIDKEDYDFILNCNKIKFLYITEPISKIYCHAYSLFKSEIFHLVFGCIENNIEKNFCKFPLYLLYSDYYYKNNKFNEINDSINNFKEDDSFLKNKKFCVLINSHDNFGTRTKIYNNIKLIENIDCPGKLFNNCSNSELNSIGNIEFIKKYIFNICPENTRCEFNGYITEKLMNSCLATAIPIYYGYFDDIDERIFNKERIIFFDTNDQKSIEDTYNFVNKLYNNKDEMKKFYFQKIFKDNACEVINELEINLINNIKKFLI